MQPAPQERGQIQEFVDDCKARLQKLLERLEWTEEGVLTNFNTNSSASSQEVAKKSKQPAPDKPATFPDSYITNNAIVLKTPKLQSVLDDYTVEAPQNFNELQRNFTREQKLQIYEYTIEHTNKLDNNTVQELAEGAVSMAEIVADAKREAKRKKHKFRKTKPTHIEEVRAVVELQMQAMQRFLANQQGCNTDNVQQMTSKEKCNNTERLDDDRIIRASDNNNYRKSSGYQDRRETSYNRYQNNNKYQKEKSSLKYQQRRESKRESNERHERISHQTSESDRYRTYKQYQKQQYENYRKRSRSPQPTRYNEENARRRRSRSPQSTRHNVESSHRQRSRSPVSTKYYEDYSRGQHSKSPETRRYGEYYRRNGDRYENGTREYEKRYRHSPQSRSYSPKRKHDKDYYRRRSKSPQSHRNSKESYHSEGHNNMPTEKDRGRQRSRSRNRETYEMKDSGNKTLVFRTIGSTQFVVKLQKESKK